jgi:hypothetical protein
MEFEEEPDYEYIENLLISIQERYNLGNKFEWESIPILDLKQKRSTPLPRLSKI